MKKTIYIILFMLIFQFCKSRNNDSANILLLQLINNGFTSNPVNKSIVVLEKVDLFNYTGDCYDEFYGINADDYYKILENKLFNSDIRKAELSKTSCPDLGFSGGFINKTKEGIRMNSYTCGYVPKACSSSAISAAGFK
ncbi:MAG: hypothetical protein KDK54_17990 [Leptospiraceae bacterium]|nr:hypothetical protein [Leptospiraceae bacterium]